MFRSRATGYQGVIVQICFWNNQPLLSFIGETNFLSPMVRLCYNKNKESINSQPMTRCHSYIQEHPVFVSISWFGLGFDKVWFLVHCTKNCNDVTRWTCCVFLSFDFSAIVGVSAWVLALQLLPTHHSLGQSSWRRVQDLGIAGFGWPVGLVQKTWWDELR